MIECGSTLSVGLMGTFQTLIQKSAGIIYFFIIDKAREDMGAQ